MEEINTWVVYKHTSPSQKCYIGITHYSDPTLRWGHNGCFYDKKTVFWLAIKKYGWDNIKHEILHEYCSEKEAKSLERKYIKYYKSLNLSYNMTIGGDGRNLGLESNTAKYRTEISRIYRKNHPGYDKEQYLKHKEKKCKWSRDWYWKNRDKVLENKKTEEEKRKNRERQRKRRANETPEQREKRLNYLKEYRKTHKNK